MKNNFSGIYQDGIQNANVIQLQGHVFLENTFRSRKPREEGPFVLAGQIRHRDEMSTGSLLAEMQ
jgi:hypothetical protein